MKKLLLKIGVTYILLTLVSVCICIIALSCNNEALEMDNKKEEEVKSETILEVGWASSYTPEIKTYTVEDMKYAVFVTDKGIAVVNITLDKHLLTK